MLMLFKIVSLLMQLYARGDATGSAHCADVSHLGQSYLVCRYDPATDDIRLFNLDATGKPYGNFQALSDDLKQRGETLMFGMNGGMYEDDLSPVGLYVEEGHQSKAISTKAGWGNFHLLPNGVFYLADGKAGVMATPSYVAAKIKPRFATQSGPMLVIDGALHPALLPQSDSFKTRNGVGVDSKGRVVLVLSRGAVRFHDLATLFRDALDCDNALFLDGSISSVYAPEINRHDRLFPMGPIIAVVAPAEAAP